MSHVCSMTARVLVPRYANNRWEASDAHTPLMPTAPDPLVSSRQDWMSGTTCLRGARVSVRGFVDHLALGYSIDYFLEQFPSVTREHVLAVLAEAATHFTDHAEVA